MSWIDQRPDDAMAGAFEAVGPEPVATVDPPVFREAMARLGAAVHVVTTAGPAGRTGFTATAVCSVSDLPPMLLVCLNRRSQATGVVRQNGVFCVNTLAAADEALADAFSGRGPLSRAQCFAEREWTNLETGAPALASAVIAFDCRIVEARAVATHNVFFAAVQAIRLGPAAPALVYHERAYKQV